MNKNQELVALIEKLVQIVSMTDEELEAKKEEIKPIWNDLQVVYHNLARKDMKEIIELVRDCKEGLSSKN
jgi:hypothetical protein